MFLQNPNQIFKVCIRSCPHTICPLGVQIMAGRFHRCFSCVVQMPKCQKPSHTCPSSVPVTLQLRRMLRRETPSPRLPVSPSLSLSYRAIRHTTRAAFGLSEPRPAVSPSRTTRKRDSPPSTPPDADKTHPGVQKPLPPRPDTATKTVPTFDRRARISTPHGRNFSDAASALAATPQLLLFAGLTVGYNLTQTQL